MSVRTVPQYALAGFLAAALLAPAVAQEGDDRPLKHHNPDGRVPTLPPVRADAPPPVCEDAPSDAEILRALPRVARGLPGVCEMFRDDVVIVKNRLVDKIDPARFFPLVGMAQLHHRHWECTVYYNEIVQASHPFPVCLKKARTQVVYIDKDHLHLYAEPKDPVPAPEVKLAAPCSVPMTPPPGTPLHGTWYRDNGVMTVALTFTPDEMKVVIEPREELFEGKPATVTVTAHYTLTKDGLLFGAITGADLEARDGKPEAELDAERSEVLELLQGLTDRPFSFRAKHTSAGLMVSGVKLQLSDKAPGTEGKESLGGLYRFAMNGKVPVVVKAPGEKARCAGGAPPAAAKPQFGASRPGPIGPEWERVGVDFNGPVPSVPGIPFGPPLGGPNLMPAPVGVVPPGMTLPPAPPRQAGGVVPTDTTTGLLALEAFGQMLQQALPRPAGGVAAPGTGPTPPAFQFFQPGPPLPLPCDAAPTPAAAPAKSGIVGTWYRDIGGSRSVVKVATDHLTATITTMQEVDDRTVAVDMVITADYQLMRDGTTAVGLITSVDVRFDDTLPPDELDEVTKALGEIRKAAEDKSFALSIRLAGDALVIGNVRLPHLGDSPAIDPAPYIGGRYTSAGDKPLPKLKAAKPAAPKPGVLAAPVAPFAPPMCAPAPALGGMPQQFDLLTLPPPSRPVAATPSVPPCTAVQTAPRFEPKYDLLAPPWSRPAGVNPPVAPCTAEQNAPQGVRLEGCSPFTGVTAGNPAKPALVGTWYREVGPLMCVLKFEGQHLTYSVHAVGLVDDKEVKEGAVVTADYHLTQNGTTVVGLVTGLDFILEGDASKALEVLEALSGADLAKIQKGVVDHPCSFNVRVYGDALMVSKVKAGAVLDDEAAIQMLFAGRYTNAGDKPVPKPKPVKGEPVELKARRGVELPSPRYLERVPQYVPVEPSASAAPGPLSSGAIAPTGVPSTPMTEPVAPGDVVPVTPPMLPPAPTAPEGSAESRGVPPAKEPGCSQYSFDPNVKMQRLLDASEDLRQLRTEWNRFWLFDQKNELTPELPPAIPPAVDEPRVEGECCVPFTIALTTAPVSPTSVALPELPKSAWKPVEASPELLDGKLSNEPLFRVWVLVDPYDVFKQVRKERARNNFPEL